MCEIHFVEWDKKLLIDYVLLSKLKVKIIGSNPHLYQAQKSTCCVPTKKLYMYLDNTGTCHANYCWTVITSYLGRGLLIPLRSPHHVASSCQSRCFVGVSLLQPFPVEHNPVTTTSPIFLWFVMLSPNACLLFVAF